MAPEPHGKIGQLDDAWNPARAQGWGTLAVVTGAS
jgi:hypothetical protein